MTQLEKELFLDLETYLREKIKKIPKSRNRPSASGVAYVCEYKSNVSGRVIKEKMGYLVESITLGKVKLFGKTNTKIMCERPINIKYKELRRKLDNIAESLFPDFEYTSICVNHNFKTKKHKDRTNKSYSYIFGVGDYTGGELVINDIKNDIHYKILKFNGKETEHYTADFKGARWTFVYFKK